MFITIPKVFDSMGLGTLIGILFFLLVLFAALTSSIALTESAVSTLQDELGWGRKKATAVIGAVMLGLGSLSSLGYGAAGRCEDHRDAAAGFLRFSDELRHDAHRGDRGLPACFAVAGCEPYRAGGPARRAYVPREKGLHSQIRFLCPFFAAIILISSVANAFGGFRCDSTAPENSAEKI